MKSSSSSRHKDKNRDPSSENSKEKKSSKSHHKDRERDRDRSDHRDSSSHHHKKDKKEKHKEKSNHKKSHKSNKSEKSEKVDKISKNGNSSIEIPSDINPNYKPPKIRPNFNSETPNNHKINGKNINMSDDYALTQMIALSKSQRSRTAVYSGRKTSAFSKDEKFPTLFQLCVCVLQDNVSRIDECGNLPFVTLKPILERGKPDDLMRIEDYNPRLMEDTGKQFAY